MNQPNYIVDELRTMLPGEPIRLLPFGDLVKNGKKRTITPELAAEFRLPHFQPPIKLGSHDDVTPAGGFIRRLFVGEDGLYGEIEYTEKGARAVADGDYRYHSPEIIWGAGGLEHPETGEVIQGPLIVGDALLHTPHLGERAALYQYEIIDKESNMSDTIEIPKTFWEKFTAWFERAELTPDPEPEPEPVQAEPEVMATEPGVDPEVFQAVTAERDELASRLAAIESEQAHRARVDHFAAQLAETRVPAELAEVFAGLTDEQAEPLMQAFRALSAQVNDTQLTEEVGSAGDGAPANPVEKLSAVIAQKQEAGLTYAAAYAEVQREQPQLIKQLYP